MVAATQRLASRNLFALILVLFFIYCYQATLTHIPPCEVVWYTVWMETHFSDSALGCIFLTQWCVGPQIFPGRQVQADSSRTFSEWGCAVPLSPRSHTQYPPTVPQLNLSKLPGYQVMPAPQTLSSQWDPQKIWWERGREMHQAQRVKQWHRTQTSSHQAGGSDTDFNITTHWKR